METFLDAEIADPTLATDLATAHAQNFGSSAAGPDLVATTEDALETLAPAIFMNRDMAARVICWAARILVDDSSGDLAAMAADDPESAAELAADQAWAARIVAATTAS